MHPLRTEFRASQPPPAAPGAQPTQAQSMLFAPSFFLFSGTTMSVLRGPDCSLQRACRGLAHPPLSPCLPVTAALPAPSWSASLRASVPSTWLWGPMWALQGPKADALPAQTSNGQSLTPSVCIHGGPGAHQAASGQHRGRVKSQTCPPGGPHLTSVLQLESLRSTPQLPSTPPPAPRRARCGSDGMLAADALLLARGGRTGSRRAHVSARQVWAH